MIQIPKIPLPDNSPGPASQRVTTGDCLEIMRHLSAGSVEIIVTSPPYNNGTAYRSYSDLLTPEAHLTWMERVAVECDRVLAPGGSLFLNVASSAQNPLRKIDILNQFSRYFVLQNEIVWIKSLAIGGITRGHFRPISSRRYLNQTHEVVFHLTKSGSVPIDRLSIGVPYADKSNVSRWRGAGGRDLRCAGNSWFIAYETRPRGGDRVQHPAAFPVELASRCIKLHGCAGLVLDPFCGTGSTLVAAKQLGMSAVGIEIDPEYARITRERFAACRMKPSEVGVH